MRTVIETPVKVGNLPAEIRGGYPAEAVVRVSLELVLDENGFTPEEADELRQAIKDAKDGIGLSPVFDNAADALAYLHAEAEKDDE